MAQLTLAEYPSPVARWRPRTALFDGAAQVRLDTLTLSARTRQALTQFPRDTMLDETGGGFSLGEHPMPPRALAAPLHRYSREDEDSFVRQGRIGALLGDEVVYGEPGDLIFKPRNQWHTFWNAGELPARIPEIISPASFERYFAAMTELSFDAAPPDLDAITAEAARFGLEFDFGRVSPLLKEYGLTFGAERQRETRRRPFFM